MAALRLVLMACCAAAVSSVSLRGRATLTANPIRRVVTMLQDMQKKIGEEGKRDQQLFDKFMCYCHTGKDQLAASIAAAETKVPQVISALDESKALKVQLEQELEQHKVDRTDAEAAIKEATSLREKEAAAFAKESGDMQTNIAAMGKAYDLIKKGMGSSFLQTTAASAVRRLVVEMDMSSVDRDIMSSFLSQGEGYAPASGQITGILSQMKETMEKDLADLTAKEEAAKASFEELVAAKNKEIQANSEAIEAKTARHGEVGVKIEELREELEDTSASYEEDKKFLADLETNCATKEQEYEVVKKTRAEETLAIAETIKILNDDDALELFKQTLPSPSLLQVQRTSKSVKKDALHAIRSAHLHDTRLDLIALALHGKAVDFGKVVAMVDEMVLLLGKEQKDDDDKKAYCNQKIDEAEDKQKELDLHVSDLGKAIEEGKAFIATTADEIKALVVGIESLDKSVVQATANRKAENEEYKATMQANGAAKELLGVAKNRLNKFYNPSLHVEAPKRELSEEDRIAVNLGGTAPPTEAPGGIAGTGVKAAALVQITAHAQREAPPPPPEAVGAYMNKAQESNGVLALVDMLVADLDKEMQEMEVEEKDAQKDYEKYVADSAEKRAIDSKSIEEKESAKADAEAALNKAEMDKKSKVEESYNNALVLRDLHGECDWLLSNFDSRKEARAGEIDSLEKAKAILSGADFA